MKEYLVDKEEVLSALDSSEDGLTSEVAKERLKQYGKNQLDEAKKQSLLSRFIDQMKDSMIMILLAAAVISGITSFVNKEPFTETIVILAVVIINALLGVYQESKAEKAIEALAAMSSATSRVIRDCHVAVVDSAELVPGDVVLLEAGDAVPADCRVIETHSLKAEEAALTGESVPVSKITEALSPGEGGDVTLGDRKNMVYMGSSIVYGRARAVVVDTGMKTQMGQIATAIATTEDTLTPLQVSLDKLGKTLSWLVLGISVLVFSISLIRLYPNITSDGILDTFMLAVSLAVAAIPEGLVAVVTIVLSIGVTSMSKRHAIIRKLTAVETLGSTQVICSDKTGTLTLNKMTVVDSTGSDKDLLARAMSLCTDVQMTEEGEPEGEPTELALVNFAMERGLDKRELEKEFPRVAEAPFDSVRKLMSTIHQHADKFTQYTKGAPDVLLQRCRTYLEGDTELPMTQEKLEQFLAENVEMADRALRVLAVAKRDYPVMPSSMEPQELEQDLCYIGLTGMIDPVRPEVADAIVLCREAGIRPVMITGDHQITAVAIARELGILDDPSQSITGAGLDTISDEDLTDRINDYSVYARVQPEHKVRIVRAWQEKGRITAMTGDGVNDAPSIKAADIGVGMGITGTDVTKNVADMVLADDNFATIVAAAEEGRRIYDNIRKAVQYLLSANLAEVIAIFVATLLNFTILRPVHLLWINLITDSFPAIALGMEEGESDLMQRPPRDPKASIFSDGMGADVLYQGFFVSILTLLAYFAGNFMETGEFIITGFEGGVSPQGMTMAFLTLSMAEMFHSLNMKSRRKSIFSLKHHNRYLFFAMVASLFMTTLVIYVPQLAEAFHFDHITLGEYGVAMLLAVCIVPMVEIVKFFQRKREQHS